MARARKFTLLDLYQVTKETLVNEGYYGFTFSILAEKLEVSRGAIYKYFDNKDELITEYMVHEMKEFLTELKNIQKYETFNEQLDYLFELIFNDTSIHKIIQMAPQIQNQQNKNVHKNLVQLHKLHLAMYTNLEEFIQLGKDEGKIKSSLHNGLILGLIFQTVAIPNHLHVPNKQWFESIKEIIQFGMLHK